MVHAINIATEEEKQVLINELLRFSVEDINLKLHDKYTGNDEVVFPFCEENDSDMLVITLGKDSL